MVRAIHDWKSLDVQLDMLFERGLSQAEAARVLCLEPRTVHDRMRRRSGARCTAAAPVIDEAISRNCLTCGKGFKAENRFRRMCPSCRSYATALATHSIAQSGGRRPGHR